MELINVIIHDQILINCNILINWTNLKSNSAYLMISF